MIFNIDKKDGNILGSIGTLGKGLVDYAKLKKQQKDRNKIQPKNQISNDPYQEYGDYSQINPIDFI